MKKINLTTNEALVLQQINEDIEDDTWSLAKRVGMTRRHVMSVISRLQQKGLIALTNSYEGLWVRLTKEGRAFIRYVWPEAAAA